MTASRRIAPQPSALLSGKQVAERLGIAERTVREMRFDGRLPTVRLGYRTVRVPAADVERLIRSRTTNR